MSRALVCYLSTVIALQAHAGGQSLKTEDLYRRLLPSVITLIVETRDGRTAYGTGFIIGANGIAATALHVVKDAKRVTARFASGEEFEVSGLIDSDDRRDIALVKIKAFGKPSAVLSTDDPRVGARAYTIGAPQALEFSISDGLISQIQTIEGIKQFQFTCPVSPGNSGGPLIDSYGKVIGVVSWQVVEGQNLNFAIPSAYVLALDKTLPTKLWSTNVESDRKANVNRQPSDLDQVLVDAIVNDADAMTALMGGWQVALQSLSERVNGKQHSALVPAYLYTYQTATANLKVRLQSAASTDPKREHLRRYLLERAVLYSGAIDLVIDSIHTLKSEQSIARWEVDAVSKIGAQIDYIQNQAPQRPRDDMAYFFFLEGIKNLFPEEARYYFALEPDSPG